MRRIGYCWSWSVSECSQICDVWVWRKTDVLLCRHLCAGYVALFVRMNQSVSQSIQKVLTRRRGQHCTN